MHRLNLGGRGIETLREDDFQGLVRLSRLNLNDNRLSDLPANLLAGLTFLSSLRVAGNALVTLPAGLFREQGDLRALYLDNNRLQTLPVGLFEPLQRLRILSMEGHRLGVVPQGLFDDLGSLAVLDIGAAAPMELLPGVFKGLGSLESLDLGLPLYGRPATLVIHSGAFEGLERLRTLWLYNAGLSELPTNAFAGLSSLRSLTIRRNRALTSLPRGAFAGLTVLEELDLRQNALSTLPEGVFAELGSLKWITAAYNELEGLPAEAFAGLESIEELDFRGNEGNARWRAIGPGFVVRVEVERVDDDALAPAPAQLVARVSTGAPYDLEVSVTVQNGSASTGEVVVPKGALSSEAFSVEQGVPGEPAHVGVAVRHLRQPPSTRVRGLAFSAGPSLALFAASANQAPVGRGVPVPHVLTADVEEARVADIGAYFEDPDGDPLVIEASASDASVVRAVVVDGDLVLSARGVGSAVVSLTASDSAGLRAWQDIPVQVEPGPDPFRYDIAIVNLNSHAESHNATMRRAADEWSRIIVDDLPDVDFSTGLSAAPFTANPEVFLGTLDDLRIHLDVGRIAHSGGPRARRQDSLLPLAGGVDLNIRDTDDADELLRTAVHEIAHVLGIGLGPLWFDLLVRDDTGAETRDPHYPGPLAVAAFDAAGGVGYDGRKVPVSLYSSGHWRGSVMPGELMSDASGSGSTKYAGALSAITLQALADQGYTVDLTQADPYAIEPGASAVSLRGLAGAENTGVEERPRCGPLLMVDGKDRAGYRRLPVARTLGCAGWPATGRDLR